MKNARGVSSSALEDFSTCMVESVERKKESEAKKPALQENRFKFELDRAEKKEERKRVPE